MIKSLTKQQRYRLRHPERVRILSREHSRKWRLLHPDRHKESYDKQNKKFGKKRCSEFRKRRIKENPRFYADNTAEWRKKNPERWNVLVARWKRKRYRNCIQFRLKQLISGSISKATKKNGTIKTKRTLELLGTDIQTFRNWLEGKFQDGMNWLNMGKFGWHIDHVMPCASFDLSDPKQQELCFHYTNLQPLWWRDNLAKGSRIPR